MNIEHLSLDKISLELHVVGLFNFWSSVSTLLLDLNSWRWIIKVIFIEFISKHRKILSAEGRVVKYF